MPKIAVSLALGGILSFACAGNFVFNEDSLLVEKSANFIEQTSAELKSKTGVNLFVFMGESLGDSTYSAFKDSFSAKLSKPFVALILFKNDKKIDIIQSQDDLLDKNKVYWEYMVPLIPRKDNELTPQALSAVVFNGYVESVDLIADKFGVAVEHNIPKDEKGARAVAQVILYIMLFSMLGIIALIYLRRHKG